MDPLAVAATLVLFAAVVFLPGLLAGYAAGLRGWLLAGTAPVLSYAIAGLAGPWLALAGVPFTLVTFGVCTAVVAGVAVLVRRRWPPRLAEPEEPTPWSRAAHLGVVAFLLLGVAVGAFTVLYGMGGLNAIPQGFDAPLHANGLRYIAETGDGSLHGMNSVHRWGDTEQLFYPNAYHLIGSAVYQLANPLVGAPIPAILNANSVLLPGLLALSLVTLVRQFRGRAVFAGAVAVLAVVPATLLYGLMIGPLLPFMLGIALLPIVPVVLSRCLDRPAPGTGMVLLLSAVGLLAVHTSAPFSSALFVAPMLLSRWLAGRDWRQVRTDLTVLAAVAVAGVVVAAPHLFGAVGRAAAPYPYSGWPVARDLLTALAELFDFRSGSGVSGVSHIALLVAAVLGIVCVRRLGRMRWMAVAALVTGTLWVLVAAVDNGFVIMLSRPWWDDPLRLMAIAAIPMTVLAAHGISEAQRWLRDVVDARVFHRTSLRPSGALGLGAVGGSASARAATTAAVVVAAFCVASGGLYVRSNAELVGSNTGNGAGRTVVSAGEARAMLELGRLAEPGDWAMNDRYDGTVWSYAIGGVRTVAGHFGTALLPSDAKLLGKRFNRYPDDPAVRAAVRRLNLRWVIVGKHGFRAHSERQAGMTGLADAPFLQLVYANTGAAVYRIVGMPPDTGEDVTPVRSPTAR